MNLLEYAHLSANGGDWTRAFAEAADAIAARGGGELLVPTGQYRTGPIRLVSHMTLRLEAGAVISFFDSPDAFPVVDGAFEGIPAPVYRSCVWADDAEDVRIAGDGTLDGNGATWWAAKRDGTLAHPRPYLVHFRRCRRASVEGVRLINSPCWTVHPEDCDDVLVRGVHIKNPADSPNTDGINPNGCQDVRILDCVIDVGDDCIAIKSGTEDTPAPRSCENILISGCQLLHGHGGVVIGSEMSGGVRGVLVTGCTMRQTDRGVRIKTRRGRGGTVENIAVANVLMDDVACPFVLNMYYHCGQGGKTAFVRDKAARPADARTPVLRDIRLSHIGVTGATVAAGFFLGLPEQPIERVSLSDVTVVMRAGSPDVPAMLDDAPVLEAAGFFLRNARGVSFADVRVSGAKGAFLDADDSAEWAVR